MTDTHTLCLAGWGQPHDALHNIAPGAHHMRYGHLPDLDAVFNALAPYATAHTAIGWSLGGRILLEAASRNIITPRTLIIIAAPMQFVHTDGDQQAMPRDTYDQFCKNYADDPMVTASRFAHIIAKGDQHYKRVAQAINAVRTDVPSQDWQHWLAWLGTITADGIDFAALPNTRYIHGDNDEVVASSHSMYAHKHTPRSAIHIVPHCAHAPHLHDSTLITNIIAA